MFGINIYAIVFFSITNVEGEERGKKLKNWEKKRRSRIKPLTKDDSQSPSRRWASDKTGTLLLLKQGGDLLCGTNTAGLEDTWWEEEIVLL